jgi:hypothetical protein
LRNQQNNIKEFDTYRVPEFLSADEKKRIMAHLFKLGYVKSPDEKWDFLVDKEFEDSFFATIYTLVQPSRKPLNEIIYDQYTKLNPKSQKAFSFICAFHQFDLPLNLELLVRALGCSYEEYYDEILPNTKGIIFEESNKGFLFYTTHHRIIAKKTIDFFFNSNKKLQELFLEVLADVNLKNSMEREIVQKLLIGRLSSESKYTDLTRKEKIEIFERVCNQHETKSLLHHLGVLLSDEGEYSRAEETLKKALITHEGGRTPVRTELEQNILTSLGVLHSRIGVNQARSPKFALDFIDQEMRIAESYFLKARFGGWPNAHSYHAYANMYLHIGELTTDALRKTNLFSIALSIIQDAKDNLNEDQSEMIYELELAIYQRLDKTDLGMDIAKKIAEKFNSAKGFILIVSNLIYRSEQYNTWPEREPFLRQARSILETAEKQFPNDEHCLSLKAKLTKRLSPLDEEVILKYCRHGIIMLERQTFGYFSNWQCLRSR